MFGCLPSEAAWELENNARQMFLVMAMNEYAEARALLDSMIAKEENVDEYLAKNPSKMLELAVEFFKAEMFGAVKS